jgi:hypothetical protein
MPTFSVAIPPFTGTFLSIGGYMKRGILQVFFMVVIFCVLPGRARASWRNSDVTTLAGSPQAFTPALSSYTAGQTEHLVFIDSNNHVHGVSRSTAASPWTDSDLTASAHGQAITQVFLTSYVAGDTQKVVYIGSGAHLRLLYNVDFEKSWHDFDLTAAANAPAFGGWLTSYTSGNTEHVVYADATNGDIQDLCQTTGSTVWRVQDLSAAVGVQRGAFNLTSYTAGADQHILYVDEIYGHVHDLMKANGDESWRDEDLTVTLYLPQSYSNSIYVTGYSLNGTEHIFSLFFNTGQMGQPSNLFELARPNAASAWQSYDLQYSINVPQPLQTAAPLDAYTVLNSQHIMYIDSSQHVHEIYLSGDAAQGWQQNDPTVSAHAPVAASDSPLTSYVTGGIQHVVYIDENSHVNVLEANWSQPWN